MSAPTNTTPAAAIVLTGVGDRTVSDIDLASAGGSNLPSCANQARNATWYTFTAVTDLFFFYIGTQFDASWAPAISVWTGPDSSTLTELVITDSGSDNQTYCSTNARWFLVPVITPGTQYWIQINAQNGVTLPGSTSLTVRLQYPNNVDAPSDAIVVSDDTSNYPAQIFDLDAGTFYQTRQFPPGEFTATLDDGRICTQNGAGGSTSVAILDADWSIATVVDFTPNLVFGIWSDRTANFWVRLRNVGGTVHSLVKINASGVVQHTTTLTRDYSGGAVAQDGSYFYGPYPGASNKIDKINLSTDAIDATFTIVGVTAWYLTGALGWCLASGNPCLFGTNGTDYKLWRIDATTGAIIDSFTTNIGIFNRFNRACYQNETYFVIWNYGNVFSSISYFHRIKYSDASVTSSPAVNTSAESSADPGNTDTDPIQWISNSCPVFTLPVSLTAIPIESTGTIIVNKVSPDVIPGFDFVTIGLSPGTFTLAPDGSREFDDVDAGDGYSIVETVPDGWSVAYTVSNGSPHINITVAAGETVTVTVTNSIDTVGSGVYQITPDLAHDEIYLTYDPVTTTDVKFDPFADIYLVGDE
jgi:hypothetical protein